MRDEGLPVDPDEVPSKVSPPSMSTISGSKEGATRVTQSPEGTHLKAIVHPPASPVKKPVHHAAPKQRGWLTLLILAALAAGGYYAYPHVKPYLSLSRPPAAPPPPRIIPVVTHSVDERDMNLYLNGLGTVTSFKTVTIRSRVDGELVNIAFKEGQMVKQGDLLAEIDARPYRVQLQEADGQLQRDKAALKLAQLDMQRYESLVASKTVTKQQLDTQRALVQQSQATVLVDEGQIDNVKLNLTYCRITAPVSGRIGLRNVDLGNMVRANEPGGLAVITQLQPIAVIFTVPQDEITRVQAKLTAGETLTVEAYDRALKTKLATGTLAAVDNQVDATTGTVRLKAVFPNKDNLLFPNEFVNGRLLIETRPHAVVVPSSAVQRGPDSMFAYVLKPDSTVDLRKIVAGPTEGDQTIIEQGLAVGETVVIDGVDKLQKGAKVAARSADSPSESGGEKPAEKVGAKAT
jgi:multidrug efflux system membrane fusion protein